MIDRRKVEKGPAAAGLVGALGGRFGRQIHGQRGVDFVRPRSLHRQVDMGDEILTLVLLDVDAGVELAVRARPELLSVADDHRPVRYLGSELLSIRGGRVGAE